VNCGCRRIQGSFNRGASAYMESNRANAAVCLSATWEIQRATVGEMSDWVVAENGVNA
jgi:hypothetical protein